eukprot:496220-Pleurochrysis_carterae.AAC.2
MRHRSPFPLQPEARSLLAALDDRGWEHRLNAGCPADARQLHAGAWKWMLLYPRSSASRTLLSLCLSMLASYFNRLATFSREHAGAWPSSWALCAAPSMPFISNSSDRSQFDVVHSFLAMSVYPQLERIVAKQQSQLTTQKEPTKLIDEWNSFIAGDVSDLSVVPDLARQYHYWAYGLFTGGCSL